LEKESEGLIRGELGPENFLVRTQSRKSRSRLSANNGRARRPPLHPTPTIWILTNDGGKRKGFVLPSEWD
jgi:hypothetical protein